MVESRCGLLCSECSFREATGCKGCVNMDKPFWADSCPVKSCCEAKSQNHCGECDDFVCSLLHTFAYDMEQSDNGGELFWKTVLFLKSHRNLTIRKFLLRSEKAKAVQ